MKIRHNDSFVIFASIALSNFPSFEIMIGLHITLKYTFVSNQSSKLEQIHVQRIKSLRRRLQFDSM